MREHVGEPPLSLTRRRVGRFHGIVNRRPAKCYSLPDTDRQGRGCARGGWSAGRGRFCWNVLRSVRARFEVLARRLVFDLCPACVSIGMSCVRSRLLFDALRQAERLAGGYVSIPS